MLPPTTSRVLLGHFLHGVDPPTVDPRASPLTVRLPTSLSLRAISAAEDRSGDVRGGAGGCKSPRDSGGGKRGGRGEIQVQKENEARHVGSRSGDNGGNIYEGDSGEREEKNN